MPLTDKELQVLRMLVAEAQKNEKKDGWLPNVTLPVSSDERRVICDKLLACGCLKNYECVGWNGIQSVVNLDVANKYV